MATNRFRDLLVVLALLPAVWQTGCGGSKDSGPALSYIDVSPTAIPLFAEGTRQLVVSAHYSDGSVKPVVSGVTFTASAPSVATVSSAGLVTAVGAGTGTVSAAMADKSADAVVAVVPKFVTVFADDFAPGVSFAPFGSGNDDIAVDTTVKHTGSASLRIKMPAPGSWAGGNLVASTPQNTPYSALTFWARASEAATLEKVGFGNGTGFSVERVKSIPLTTEWVKHVIPVPVPELFTINTSLFHWAEGSQTSAYTVWIDDIQYENLPSSELGLPTDASLGWVPIRLEVNQKQVIQTANTVTYANPAMTLVNVGSRFFTFSSSNPAVASVSNGTVTGVSVGTAVLTARLGTLDVPGSAVATVATMPAPPTPTVPAADVISLLSKAYPNRPVSNWCPNWGQATTLTELSLDGNPLKKYASLNYVGVDFSSNLIDASGMTHFHIDIYTPDMTSFSVKLVDFGPNGAYQGGDDSEATFTATSSTTPALTGQSQWVSLDIPLTSFAMPRKNLAQLVFVSGTGSGTVYVGNVYFHK